MPSVARQVSQVDYDESSDESEELSSVSGSEEDFNKKTKYSSLKNMSVANLDDKRVDLSVQMKQLEEDKRLKYLKVAAAADKKMTEVFKTDGEIIHGKEGVVLDLQENLRKVCAAVKTIDDMGNSEMVIVACEMLQLIHRQKVIIPIEIEGLREDIKLIDHVLDEKDEEVRARRQARRETKYERKIAEVDSVKKSGKKRQSMAGSVYSEAAFESAKKSPAKRSKSRKSPSTCAS